MTRERLDRIRAMLNNRMPTISKAFLYAAAIELLQEVDRPERRQRTGEGRPVATVDVATIVRLREQGMSLEAIAEQIAVSRETIRRRLNGRLKESEERPHA